MPTIRSDYVAPRWLPGAHLQTVVPARFFPRPHVSYRRELIDMPDGDFMTFDWVKPEPEAPTRYVDYGDITAPAAAQDEPAGEKDQEEA